MKRICVIGNSHVGALKSGYDSLETKPCEVLFWSIPGGHGPLLHLDKGKLCVDESLKERVQTTFSREKPHEINLLSFDAIVLASIGLRLVRQNQGNRKECLAAGFLSSNVDYKSQLLSNEVYKLYVEASLEKQDFFQSIKWILSIAEVPVFILPSPYPTPGLKQIAEKAFPYGETFWPFVKWYHDLQHTFLQDRFRQRPAIVLKYPTEWQRKGYTPKEFAIQADCFHLNAAFGRLFWESILLEQCGAPERCHLA